MAFFSTRPKSAQALTLGLFHARAGRIEGMEGLGIIMVFARTRNALSNETIECATVTLYLYCELLTSWR
jgi:hypothetical protein